MKKLTTIYFLFALLLALFSQSSMAGESISKRYLITASTSGFGIAICETLASEGHSLILAGRNEIKLNTLKANLEKKYHGKYTIELFDYSEPYSLPKLGSKLKNQTIDGIVVIPPRVKITATEIPQSEEWADMFKIGFISPLEIIRQALPVLKPEGSIVVISGLTSVHYLENYKNSNVLRKMWIAEVKNLVYQLGDRKIRVNSISPGVILTEFHKIKIQERALKNNKTIEGQLKDEAVEIPLRQHGQPEDIAQSTSFLLSTKAAHINGVNLVIDGGLSKSY